MKNLANCKPSEFLRQTNRIRKSVEKWLTETDIMSIRKRMPKMPDIVTPEERKKLMSEQARKNLSAILDAALEEHPDETLELLALMCFVEPENVDDYPVADYLGAFAELIGNRAVLDFFTSLMQLARTDTFDA